jgi:hypothetical protein
LGSERTFCSGNDGEKAPSKISILKATKRCSRIRSKFWKNFLKKTFFLSFDSRDSPFNAAAAAAAEYDDD